MKGILGRKAGMSTIFTDDGKAFPVTIVEVLPNVVMQVKTLDKDGYKALKLGYGDKKEQRATKPQIGAAKKAKTSPKYFEAEIRGMEGFEMGSQIDASIFKQGDFVDVVGTSKGKGFAGNIKRHNKSRGPETHGSKFHRAPGSLGSISGQVFKTKPLPGRLGGQSSTAQNLFIVSVDLENNAIAIRGSIPGPNLSYVIIKDSWNRLNKTPKFKLVDVKEEAVKNELLIEAKHVGAQVNTAMTISEMKEIIAQATIKHAAEIKEREELIERASHVGVVNAGKMAIDELRKTVEQAERTEAERKAKHDADMAAKAESEAKGAAENSEDKKEGE